MLKYSYVYILTNQRRTVFYIGVTSDLPKRVWEHKQKLADSFTRKYNIDQLVYYEQSNDIESAIAREKKLKRWRKQWKVDLIEENNPNWRDLFDEINQ